MSRRPPPPSDYFDDEPYPMDQTYPRSRRRERDFDDDVDYRRRRRSMPPEEEMERMHISSQRPPPIPLEYMRDPYAMPAAPVPPREPGPSKMMRRSREEVDNYLGGPDREDPYARPRRRRNPRPREMDEDLIDEREVRGGRRQRVPRDVEPEEVIEEREKRTSRRPRFDDEEGLSRRRERASHRGYDSEREVRPRERRGSRLEDERDEMVSRSSRRSQRPRRREEREELLDEPEPEARSVDPAADQRVMQWKDQPTPEELEEETRRERRSRRSPPDSRSSMGRPPPGAFPVDQEEVIDDEAPPRSRLRSGAPSGPMPGSIEDDEIALRREERSHRRGSSERDEPVSRKSKRSSPQERIRTPEIVMPPVHEEMLADEEYEPPASRLPRAPSPEIQSTHTSFDEVDVRHQSSRGSRRAEEDLSSMRREEDDESISPTSGPVDFHNPFSHADRPRRRKPRSRRESESMAAGSSRSRGTRELPREFPEEELDVGINDTASRPRSHIDPHPRSSDSLVKQSRSRGSRGVPRGLEEDDYGEDDEIQVQEKISRARPRGNGHPRDSTDEWSVVHAPSKEEAIEMSGGLDIVEVAPRGDSSSVSGSESDESEDTGRGKRGNTSVSKDERWTEITKELVVREAIERMGYEHEEMRHSYYIFSYLEPQDIDELVEFSDAIRKARRRRIREMQRERAAIPVRPAPPVIDPRVAPRPRYGGERRVREREWVVPPYH